MSLLATQRDLLLRVASALEKIEGVDVIEIGESSLVLTANREGKQYEIEFKPGRSYPFELPSYRLLEPSKHGLLPHVCWRGQICYNDGEGVSVDVDKVEEVAQYSLREALKILPSGNDSPRMDAFFDEFEGYWNMQNVQSVHLLTDLPSELTEIRFVQNKKLGLSATYYPAAEEQPSETYSFLRQLKKNGTEVRALFMPLEQVVQPPLPGEELGFGFVDRLVNNLSTGNREAWSRIKARSWPKPLLLVASQLRPSGGDSLFGVLLDAKGVRAFNAGTTSETPISPIKIVRHTRTHLTKRGGLGTNHIDRKFTIIGCGAVGGRIAELLVMSGYHQLRLIDPQELTEENLFRHVLGSSYVGQNKAHALKHFLEAKLPQLDLEALDTECVNSDYFYDSDFAVVAIGSPTTERRINEQFRSLRKTNACLITAWVEAGGVGGHVVTSVSEELGCLNCLYQRDGTQVLSGIESFVTPGQVVTQNLTGCGGAFVPYGAVHASKTANLVMDSVSNICQDKPVERYLNWVGENETDISLELTKWYHQARAGQDIGGVFKRGCVICQTD